MDAGRQFTMPLHLLFFALVIMFSVPAMADDTCDKVRLALRSSHGIGDPAVDRSTQADRIRLWDAWVAKFANYGEYCREPNPYRSNKKQKFVQSSHLKADNYSNGTRNSSGNLTDTANVEPSWSNDTKVRIKGIAEKEIEVAEMEDYAPYTTQKCVVHKPAPNRGKIDWDWVKITNRCSFPVEVLECYYDVGHEADCNPGGKNGWGMVHIEPGQTVTDVASSKRYPWLVKYDLCDMTPIKHNRMLCVRPSQKRKK